MSSRLTIKPGTIYGRVTVIKEVEPRGKRRCFLCQCSCGHEWEVPLIQLTTGQTKSCGCLRRERFVKKLYSHGQSRTRLYDIWTAMKQRCFNKNNPIYSYYGGRGITVCDNWLEFESFQSWAVENRYTDDLTIERKDVDGNYEPNNCVWIPKSEQSSNTRRTHLLSYNGQTMSIKDWAKRLGINYDTLYGRIFRGWSIDEALSQPVKEEKPRRAM